MDYFLNEHRCDNCNKLLFKGELSVGQIETKCNRCGEVKIVNGVHEGKNSYSPGAESGKIFKDGAGEDYQKEREWEG